ncbi:hypothetical protein D4764_08G0004790 [Takifugu flavidus]|uniref:Uncharacterized protein n=1 Tax=Takifugu flavidus TaxID=433684 RepID=A0A5C6MMV0_9TELE|nr:hypothetical protein D4764_08G0004790 [Takifugu flavidus]
MNAQLLLLLALAGPFCAFTRATHGTPQYLRVGVWGKYRGMASHHSAGRGGGGGGEDLGAFRSSGAAGTFLDSPGPTLIPTNTDSSVIQPATLYNSAPPKSNFVTTGPPPTEPDVVVLEITAAPAASEVPPEMTTAAAASEVPPEMTIAAAASEVPPEMTTAAAASEVPQKVTMEATPEVDLNDTMVASQQTEVPGQLLSTHAATAETAAPTKEAEVVQTSGTAAATTESIGFQKQTGLTSGQAVGIAIGVLLAAAFVIAVVIVVARRMGKYS